MMNKTRPGDNCRQQRHMFAFWLRASPRVPRFILYTHQMSIHFRLLPLPRLKTLKYNSSDALTMSI